MTETHTEGLAEEVVVVAARPGVGERLREARTAKDMGVADVAAALKLSPRQVEALEAGDWAALPGHAFVRGFVRNYARFIQIDADALLADLDAPKPPPVRLDLPQNASAVMPASGQAQRRDYAAVLAGLVLVAVAVVAYFVVPQDFWKSEAKAPEAESAAAPAPLFPPPQAAGDATAAPASAPVPASAAVPAEAAAPSPAVAVPAATPLPAPAAASVSPSAAAASANAIRLRFAQPSWVEIRDRSGQIVFSQLNAAGSEHAVEGQPPFALVVGNATHVTVSYKGRDIELQPRSKDDVARVTVE